MPAVSCAIWSRQRPVRRSPKRIPTAKPRLPPAPAGPAIHVRAFRIEGNQLIPTPQIQQLLAGYMNRDLTPADLRQATDSIAHLYDHRGWLARVLVAGAACG